MIPVISTKAMVRSGEVNQLAMKKFGSQMLGHTWDSTQDKISFKLQVDVSTKKDRACGKHKLITMENIDELKEMALTRRLILAIVAACYDPRSEDKVSCSCSP